LGQGRGADPVPRPGTGFPLQAGEGDPGEDRERRHQDRAEREVPSEVGLTRHRRGPVAPGPGGPLVTAQPASLDLEPVTRLLLDGISKRFPSVLANDDITFSVRAGEIHALLGENGAGKSTLMDIAYGLYRPDAGRIVVDGIERRFRSPKDAMGVG